MDTVKKKTYGYKERNEDKRRVYLKAINEIRPQDRIYLDETGIDDNECYDYAWGQKGLRVYGMKYAERKKRLSIISALGTQGLIAPLVFEGTCDRSLFEVYLKDVLVPELSPGKTLILDNASFHKGGKIAKIIHQAGCSLLYLPAYSPDLNPIENRWSGIKHGIRKNLSLCNRDLYKAAESFFEGISN